MNLDLIALNNLQILSNIDNENDFINIIDKIKFKIDKKDESFKNIVELSSKNKKTPYDYTLDIVLKSNKHMNVFIVGISLDNIQVIKPNTIVPTPKPINLIFQYCPKYSYENFVACQNNIDNIVPTPHINQGDLKNNLSDQ